MELIIGGETEPSEELLNLMRKAASLVLKNEGIRTDDIEISVSIVGEESIKRLNFAYRGIDSVTDVLSFPQFDPEEEIPSEGEVSLGDVVICLERAKSQAIDFGHSEEREIVYLFTHSILHLVGYDHMDEEDKGKMRDAEEKVMEELSLER
jgi:metalloprotein, YbeY/UPF0054 family